MAEKNNHSTIKQRDRSAATQRINNEGGMAMAGEDVTAGKATMARHNDSLRRIITMAMGYQIMP